MFFSFFCNNISCTHHSKWPELQQIELRPKYGSDINFMSFTSLAKTGLLCKYESTRVEIRTSREGGASSALRQSFVVTCVNRALRENLLVLERANAIVKMNWSMQTAFASCELEHRCDVADEKKKRRDYKKIIDLHATEVLMKPKRNNFNHRQNMY